MIDGKGTSYGAIAGQARGEPSPGRSPCPFPTPSGPRTPCSLRATRGGAPREVAGVPRGSAGEGRARRGGRARVEVADARRQRGRSAQARAVRRGDAAARPSADSPGPSGPSWEIEHVPQSALAGPLSRRLAASWDEGRAWLVARDEEQRAKHGGRPPDFGDPRVVVDAVDGVVKRREALVAGARRARLTVDASEDDVHAELVVTPGTGRGERRGAGGLAPRDVEAPRRHAGRRGPRGARARRRCRPYRRRRRSRGHRRASARGPRARRGHARPARRARRLGARTRRLVGRCARLGAERRHARHLAPRAGCGSGDVATRGRCAGAGGPLAAPPWSRTCPRGLGLHLAPGEGHGRRRGRPSARRASRRLSPVGATGKTAAAWPLGLRLGRPRRRAPARRRALAGPPCWRLLAAPPKRVGDAARSARAIASLGETATFALFARPLAFDATRAATDAGAAPATFAVGRRGDEVWARVELADAAAARAVAPRGGSLSPA